MSLQPLANPQTRFAPLPTSMSWRKNPADNSPVWNIQIQYYVNDVVVSGLDGGAYVFSGDGLTLATSETVTRGGTDPAVTAGWSALGPVGAGWNNWDQSAPTFAAAVVAGPLPAVTNGVLTETASSTWLVTFQGTQTRAVALAATDLLSWTVTPNGAGAVPVTVAVVPSVGAASHDFSVSMVVTLPAAVLPATTGTLTLSGTVGGTDVTVTNGLWTILRLA